MTPDLIKKVEGLASRLQEPIIADALCIGQIRSGLLAERLIRERGEAADCLLSGLGVELRPLAGERLRPLGHLSVARFLRVSRHLARSNSAETSRPKRNGP